MKLKFTILLIFCCFFNMNAQDGYWDKERATNKEIKAPAGEKIIVSSEEFPSGTTEVIYRITLLDENQQISSSLVSVLKAIPEPTGISKGAAGLVFLMSKISGDDTCQYAVFSDFETATDYVKTAKNDKACFVQNEAISKDAKRLVFNNLPCFSKKSNQIWFVFESKNWVMKQKIILEVVPWVDKKSSNGWTLDNKLSLLIQIKKLDLAKKMRNPDVFCATILEKIQAEYSFDNFQKLLPIEKNAKMTNFGLNALLDTAKNQAIISNIRKDALQFFNDKKYSQAIDLLQASLVETKLATGLDYNLLGACYLFSNQYDKAIKTLKAGEALDNTELLIQLNLAHAYLLNGDYRTAKNIHKQYKNQNVSTQESWKVKAKKDIENFQKSGMQHDDFDDILDLLNKE